MPFRISTDDAVATLWLDCPALGAAAVQWLVAVAEAVAARPAVEVLVVRSARPSGFPPSDRSALAALSTDAEAAAFAVAGQTALRTFAELPIPTVAFLEGPCIGAGWELALACDYRLAVATPDAVLSFGDLPTAWGGRARLAKRIGKRTAKRFVGGYPREAALLGAVDDAFCLRRAKIELRTFLDRLQFRPVKRGAPTDAVAEAEERKRFRAAVRDGHFAPPEEPTFEPRNPVPALPRRVGVVGVGADAVRWVGEFALRGVPVTWFPPPLASRPAGSPLTDWRYAPFVPWHPLTTRSRARPFACPFRAAVARGRVTPLEAEQAAARVTTIARPDDALTADLVVIDDTDDGGTAFLERVMPARSVLLLPAGDLDWVLPSCDRPGRVLGWAANAALTAHADATDDALAAAVRWLQSVGEVATVRREVATPVRVPERVAVARV